ncbi:GMC family oxidoreductase [Azospirillum sp. RWY-5-1]|uniref:GMC family oxidoreductase n=1 Tax=Azospirillum oleiclasticum TaxID=2735135 RepID=A0ABX2T8U8_9PROT|nr:GMC family oxidoreductase [Azospirillum oleiclasticum]NYZ13341.1 GMC family oxidoreductase [Azospirillum oleiclasticum]NYZ20502.1 GMC family oxidoreductase [Azospirillum oleiclasticum]
MILDATATDRLETRYELVVIGSGFGSLFFVQRWLEKRPDSRVLVLEWGGHNDHAWQMEHDRTSPIRPGDTIDAPHPEKEWNFTIGLGGGTNCWYAQSPRLHPNDFRTKSLYGVGRDWPMSYDELEPFYGQAERIMSISGPEDIAAVYPRSTPYPQPPHRMTSVDRVMKAAQPDRHFVIPTGRARLATEQRPACCASGRCYVCPADAKFTALNGMRPVLDHPRATVALGCRVTAIETAGGVATGVVFQNGGRERRVAADLVVLGANAIHSPHILLSSGIDHPMTGRGLHEQLGFGVEVLLDGLDNFDGSTITTGINLSLLDGPFRKEHGGALVYFENRWTYGLRKEYGRWRQTLPLVVVVEDLPQDGNRVLPDPGARARVEYSDAAGYAHRGVQAAIDKLPQVLAPLPVEDIILHAMRRTESHVQGTLRMGTDPAETVVDRHLVHHGVRNLIAVGTAVFPTSACANPSLTAAALSLWAAEHAA